MPTVAERFWAKVERGGDDECWLWTGATTHGHGQIGINGRSVYAHRWSYEQAKGPIPDGLHIDHLCRVRNCVNPDHLEAVTNRENIMRGQSPSVLQHWSGKCAKGHDKPHVGRCRTCHRLYMREYQRWVRRLRGLKIRGPRV